MWAVTKGLSFQEVIIIQDWGDIMKVYGLSDTGLSRDNNQDSLFYSDLEDFPLFIVADGMGGHNEGKLASNIAVETIKGHFIDNKDSLKNERAIIENIEDSVSQANKKIYFEALSSPECSGMGTTLTMAYIFENKVYISHIGDSRAYYIDDTGIIQVTEDDSLVNELIKNGSITEEEALNHPKRNIITKALGTSIDMDVDVHTLEYKVGDFMIICSDGLTNMVRENIIFDIIKKEEDIKIACRKLVDFANENGGLDNITLIIIKFE